MSDKLFPEREAEIDRLIGLFREGTTFTADTGVEWEFVNDLPDGGVTLRKISPASGNRTHVTWEKWKVRLEFNLLIESRLEKDFARLNETMASLNNLKRAVSWFLQKGTINFDAKNYEPLIREAAKGDVDALQAWFDENPHDAEMREIAIRMFGADADIVKRMKREG